ncbi:hypothetical protein ACWDDN_39840, partial [Streptomyces griseoruber]
ARGDAAHLADAVVRAEQPSWHGKFGMCGRLDAYSQADVFLPVRHPAMTHPTTDGATLGHACGLADVVTGRSAGDRGDAVSPAGFIVGEAEPEDRRR